MQCRIFRFVLLSFCFFLWCGFVFLLRFSDLSPIDRLLQQLLQFLTRNECNAEFTGWCCLFVLVFCLLWFCFSSLRISDLSTLLYSLLPFTFTDRACQFYCQFYWYLTDHCLAFALNIHHSILPALKMRRRPSRGIPSLNSQSYRYHRITLTSCRPAPCTALERASLTSRRILAPGHSALQQMQHTPSHL